MNRPLPLPCALLLGEALAQFALAQPAQARSPLKLLLSQELVTVVTERGKTVEKLTPSPPSVQPGDTLTQQVSVSNTGQTPLKNAGINVPVPRGTVYLGGADLGGADLGGADLGGADLGGADLGGATASSPRWQTQFSFDGGKTFGSAPLTRTVSVTENGKSLQKQVVVPPGEYTNVRWLIASIAPDETLKLGFRVKVK